MEDIKLGLVESHFADIVWESAPLSTKELIVICAKELNWKRTTTYTVLRKLCEKGIFKMENSMVTVLISRKDFYLMQSEKLVEDAFSGSLPAFLAAFAARKNITSEELDEIRRLLDNFEEA